MPKKPNAAFLANYAVALAKAKAAKANPPTPTPPPTPTKQPTEDDPAIPSAAQSTPSAICATCGEDMRDCACPSADSIPEHPLLNRWAIKSCKLIGKSKYFVLLSHPFFLVVRECGIPLQVTRHVMEFYTIPDDAKVVSDIIGESAKNPAFAKLISTPFLFHAELEARKAITLALKEVVEMPTCPNPTANL